MTYLGHGTTSLAPSPTDNKTKGAVPTRTRKRQHDWLSWRLARKMASVLNSMVDADSLENVCREGRVESRRVPSLSPKDHKK